MNAANAIALSAPQPFAYGKSASAAALNPVRGRFGRFELDEADARLSRDGTAVTLARRLFARLCALARRLGSLLIKHTLLDDIRGHQFVSESVLRTAVSDVRTVLDDHPGCTLLQPVFATMEEVRYAHELRLQLRERLQRNAAPPTQPWFVGAD